MSCGRTVEDLVKTYISKLGENIKVTRFVRYNMGETAEVRLRASE